MEKCSLPSLSIFLVAVLPSCRAWNCQARTGDTGLGGRRRGTLRASFLPQHFVSHSTNTQLTVSWALLFVRWSLRGQLRIQGPQKSP